MAGRLHSTKGRDGAGGLARCQIMLRGLQGLSNSLISKLLLESDCPSAIFFSIDVRAARGRDNALECSKTRVEAYCMCCEKRGVKNGCAMMNLVATLGKGTKQTLQFWRTRS